MGRKRAGIVGGAGYTGGETIRLLLAHPDVELSFVQSRSQAGKHLYDVHEDLVGDTTLKFSADVLMDVDVIFLCLGHGESSTFLTKNSIPEKVKLIDLSNDFRVKGDHSFIYGLPELNREKIKDATRIANPGCFATSIQLALLPLAKTNLLQTVHTTAITGSTGAGRQLQDTTHFSWRSNNISAYKTLTHQHLAEIHQSLHDLQPSFNNDLHFVPWRGDFTRGIFASSTVSCNTELNKVKELYEQYYQDHPFTTVSSAMINLKQVVNTNKCLIHLEKVSDQLVIHSTIDNLVKGASGQAVQNMNLMLGLKETSGLKLKALAL